jgi:hypothetical protein
VPQPITRSIPAADDDNQGVTDVADFLAQRDRREAATTVNRLRGPQYSQQHFNDGASEFVNNAAQAAIVQLTSTPAEREEAIRRAHGEEGVMARRALGRYFPPRSELLQMRQLEKASRMPRTGVQGVIYTAGRQVKRRLFNQEALQSKTLLAVLIEQEGTVTTYWEIFHDPPMKVNKLARDQLVHISGWDSRKPHGNVVLLKGGGNETDVDEVATMLRDGVARLATEAEQILYSRTPLFQEENQAETPTAGPLAEEMPRNQELNSTAGFPAPGPWTGPLRGDEPRPSQPTTTASTAPVSTTPPS